VTTAEITEQMGSIDIGKVEKLSMREFESGEKPMD
jgi:hypothetical protein